MRLEGTKNKTYKKFTLRLPKKMCDELDGKKKTSGLSRQELIEAILEQVLEDKTFVLKVR